MLELIPDRMAVCKDHATTLDLLVRITPQQPPQEAARPELNLALVLDRSGSMTGPKLELTRQAAGLAVRSLGPEDRVSVVLFDDRVETLVPSTPVTDKNRILHLLSRVNAGGSTALHSGWRAGGQQAEQACEPRRLNRVVLLTDGQANVGETNPDTICHDVHELARRGIQTSTLGFGTDYNENLLRSMASSGEGNHFFVETPEQLVGYFQLELGGLTATQGTRVRLELKGLVPDVMVEMLGELEATPEGYKLGDLVAGCPLEQVFRVSIPAQKKEIPFLSAGLTWMCPREGASKSLKVPLTLPLMTFKKRQALPVNPDVEQHVAIAMGARARREAMQALRSGDRASASRLLRGALETQRLPDFERAQLEDLARTVEQGDAASSYKKSASISHSYSSVSLHKIEGLEVHKMISGGTLALRVCPAFNLPPQPTRHPWERMEAMLRGLFHGERLGKGTGEATALVLAALENASDDKVNPDRLARTFNTAVVNQPGPSLRAFRANLDQGMRWQEAAVTSAGCGALQRIPAVLVPHWDGVQVMLFWTQPILACRVTHNDCAALVSCLGFSILLWELMAMSAPPRPTWYLERFLAVRDAEIDTPYRSRASRYDGWEGNLTQFLEQAVGEARQQGWEAHEAYRAWGSGAYLLETVPTLLYLLERHGHDPSGALQAATGGPAASGPLGALVGAAMGALHGVQPDWSLGTETEQALTRIRQRFG
ncbi:MAG: ADP-ribosylglycohydrolase family protein [Candidatus Eremiobacterota bacterium]